MRGTWKKITVNSHSALANAIHEYQNKGYQITYEKSGIEYVMTKGKNYSTVQITRS